MIMKSSANNPSQLLVLLEFSEIFLIWQALSGNSWERDLHTHC